MKQFLNRLLGRTAPSLPTPVAPATVSPLTDDQRQAQHLLEQGHALEDAGQPAAAETLYLQALALCPHWSRIALNLGNALAAQGRFEDAAARYEDALRLEPGYGAAHANLGQLHLTLGHYQPAANHYAAAVQALPQSADALVGLGCALEELQRYQDALDAYRRALAINPDFAGAKLNLGRTLILLNQSEDAVSYLEEAVAAMPDNGLAYALLGQALSNLCLIEQAVTYQRRALELNAPNEALLAHIVLFNSNCLPDCTADMSFAAHRDYGQRYCSAFYPQNPRYDNRPDPERRLKIGYVSGDFREHPVSRFIEPVFTHHDPAKFETHAFYNHHLNDEMTTRLRSLVAGWHSIAGQDDATVAELIRMLGIDILIDLSGHTEYHRLFIFARKPAPVQATWLGYLGTTGLATMDYRICDVYTDPPGLTEYLHTEKLLRLPQSQWSHISYAHLPPIGELPLTHNGYLTLGSFNKASKLNEQTLELWASILNIIPQSRLMIASVSTRRTADYFAAIFEKAGIARERIQFMPRLPYRDYLTSIAEADVALDSFPYNGGTTSIDTLIMGVPVVTLMGDRPIARGGVSLLSNLGLTELIATTPQDYVNIVRQLAHDPVWLTALRNDLRNRVQTSSLLDGKHFTSQLEALYRQMWREWCNAASVHHLQ